MPWRTSRSRSRPSSPATTPSCASANAPSRTRYGSKSPRSGWPRCATRSRSPGRLRCRRPTNRCSSPARSGAGPAAIADLQEGPTSAQAREVAKAHEQTQRFKADLQDAASLALDALRAWGAEHVRAKDTWWSELDAKLNGWLTDTFARAQLWQQEQDQLSRLTLAQDLEAVQRLVAIQEAGAQDSAKEYLARLDGATRTVVATLAGSLSGGGGPDVAGALTAGIRERVRARDQRRLEEALQKIVLALDPFKPEDFKSLEALLKVVQPDVSLKGKAAQIHEAVARYRGHDEESIFEALSGLSPIAGMLLPVVYEQDWKQTLEDALRGKRHVGKLDTDEMLAAHQLLRGDRVEGAVGAINSAITGRGRR